jgi:hypothetical protein
MSVIDDLKFYAETLGYPSVLEADEAQDDDEQHILAAKQQTRIAKARSRALRDEAVHLADDLENLAATTEDPAVTATLEAAAASALRLVNAASFADPVTPDPIALDEKYEREPAA